MKASDEKLKLEHEAARIFMRLYEKRFGVAFRHIWHNEPAKPDVSCYLANDKLDLEIAHLYGSEVEAMHILGRSLDEKTQQELHALLQTPADTRLLTALNRIICNKAEKTYQTDRVWLVIRNANPLWSKADLLAYLDDLVMPESPPFEQIWLIGDMQGESGMVALYPLALREISVKW